MGRLCKTSRNGEVRLRRKNRGKRGRIGSAEISPIEDPGALGRLVYSAREEGLEALVYVLLHLDAGMRSGEALGLRWGDVAFGDGPEDRSRHLYLRHNRPRGGEDEAPKSGRARKVALSYRLRGELLALARSRFEPGPDERVLREVEPANFRHREWRRILKRAGLTKVALKSLRDTFASQLLSAGIQLPYVSRQLGHADVGVTSRHYARWVGGDDYREPLALAASEVPADLLARIAPEVPTKSKPVF